jgi:RNA polymerase sigma-70 factor (ECF subfamily)
MKDDTARREQFLALLLESESALRAFVAGALATVEDRADLFQEIVMVLWRCFDRYDSSRPFRPWALGVALRRTKEERRRRQRLPGCLTPENLERLAAALERPSVSAPAQEEEALTECLKLLPPQSARLMQRRYYEDAGIDALAAETGQSPAAVYQTLSRTRQRLAQCIRQRLRRPETQRIPAHEN